MDQENGGLQIQSGFSAGPEEWKERTQQIREALSARLIRLESGEVQGAERDKLIGEMRALIRRLKRDQRSMVGCLAEEAAVVDEMETRLRDAERAGRRRFGLFRPGPTNAQIEQAERSLHHFAQGRSVYKLFWVFFIGSFAGVLIEQAWCMIRYGFFEPRVGLVYGPFNLVYGIGAWALTAALYTYRNRSKLFSFLGGALVGSGVEYLCSLFQEMVFGSASWDYSGRPFNLNGRICLLYSVYWGILGVIWIKSIYPRLAALILKIPNRIGRPLTAALAVFMLVNSLMTGAAVLRWMERTKGLPAVSAYHEWLDGHFPDKRMERLFTNLKFVINDAEQMPPPEGKSLPGMK